MTAAHSPTLVCMQNAIEEPEGVLEVLMSALCSLLDQNYLEAQLLSSELAGPPAIAPSMHIQSKDPACCRMY